MQIYTEKIIVASRIKISGTYDMIGALPCFLLFVSSIISYYFLFASNISNITEGAKHIDSLKLTKLLSGSKNIWLIPFQANYFPVYQVFHSGNKIFFPV